MRLLVLLVLIAGVAAELLDGIYNLDEAPEPMVAFSCGRPSLYKTEEGWKVDKTQNCLSKPDEIAAYCALKYPSQNITGFIPASKEEVVNWESFTGVVEKISVRPYRCFGKEFNSDALLVPDGCQFAHFEYGSEDTGVGVCQSYEQWNVTSLQRCVDAQSMLYSFSVIVPCAAGTFSGVEYVCCPAANSTGTSEIDQFFNAMPKPLVDSAASRLPKQTSNDYYYADGDASSTAPTSVYQVNDETISDSEEKLDDPSYDPATNYYVLYMETPEKLGKNEHEAFTKAISFTKRYYREEQKRLDEQLAVLDARYAELSAKNVSMAKTLYNREFQTLQNLFNNVRNTWAAIRSAINNEHERRVVSALENRRLDRVENFMNALDEAAEYDDLQAVKPLMQALKQYINSEEKERIHWINRYEHMLDTNPDEAERMKMTVKEMLLQIQQRIASVTQSLQRVPRIRATVSSLLNELLSDFKDVDQEVRFLFPDLDLAADVQNLMPELLPSTPLPVYDEVITERELDYPVSPNWFDERSLVGTVSNRTFVIVIGASVVSAILCIVIFFICYMHKFRASTSGRMASRKSHVRSSLPHIYLVSPALIATSKGSFSDLPVDPRCVAPAEDTVRRMQMRGYKNPLDSGCLKFQDNETAALVENDANEQCEEA